MPGYTYKIKKKAKEVGDTLVEKHGLCAVFSLRDLNREMRDCDKEIASAQGNADLNNMTVKNIEQHHPWLAKLVADLKPLQLHTAQMYFTAKAKRDMYLTMTKQSKKTLKLLKDEDKRVRELVTKK